MEERNLLGARAEKRVIVEKSLTADHMGSGNIEVYATPAMIALMEAAAVAAIERLLDEGQTSVGISVEVKHLAATALGQQVRALAEVTTVSGRRVDFLVRAWDESELIGEGSHSRFIVDQGRFMERVRAKAEG